MICSFDAADIYVHQGGESHKPGAPSIVFVHGAAMDHSVWTLFSRFYAKAGYNVASIDLPGHGNSSGEPCTDIASAAQVVSNLIDKLELTSPALVGHSMGALIALEAAANISALSRLVLMGCCYPMRVSKPLLNAAKENDHASVDMISLFGHSYASQLGGCPVAGIYVQNLAERLMEKAADGVMYHDLAACNNYADGLAAAAGIDCPVTLISGDSDMMTPVAMTAELLGTFANGEQILLKNCGHMMMSEQPEAAHQALAKALNYGK